MSNSQVLHRLLSKIAATSGAAPFTPDLTGGGFNTVKTPGPSPADAPSPTPMNQVKNFAANTLNQGKNFANNEIGAGKNEYQNELKPAAQSIGAAFKPGLQEVGHQAQNYFKGLGTNPGQWAGQHPIGVAAGIAGLGTAGMLLYHLLKKKPQPEGQPKIAAEGGEFMPGQGPHLAKVTPPPAVPTQPNIPLHVDKGLEGARANVGDGINNVVDQVGASAKSPTPIAPGADAPVPVNPAAKPGLMAQAGGAIMAHKGIAAAGLGVGAAAILAHMLNKPSKKDEQGHVAVA